LRDSGKRGQCLAFVSPIDYTGNELSSRVLRDSERSTTMAGFDKARALIREFKGDAYLFG